MNCEFLNGFRSENWNQLASIEKMALLQDMEILLAKLQNRNVREVLAVENFTAKYPKIWNLKNHEYYSPGYYFVNMGMNYHSLTEVIHEGRHAYQDDCLFDIVPNPDVSYELLELWRLNHAYRGYYDYKEEAYYDYRYAVHRFQPIEVDCYDYEIKIFEMFKEKFLDDPEYLEHLNELIFDQEKCMEILFDKLGSNYQKQINNHIRNLSLGKKSYYFFG